MNDAKRLCKKKGRQKYEYQCAACNKWYKGADVQVDHIVPCGSLKSYDDLPRFVKLMFCEADNLQVLCKECHQDKTNKEREERT
jgi:5-methylcytosine-specific restriction endonuclease McrA